jgi:hypothetical protein
MQKRFLKYLLVLVVLAGGAMIFLYAQNGYIFRKPATTNTEKEKEEQADDIGTPTDDDPFTEMDKLVTAYYHKQGSSFKGIVKLIDDNGKEEKIIEQHLFEYTVLNEEFYYSLDKMEVVQKKDMLLVVDNTNKLVSMSFIANSPGKTKKLFDIGEFKKLMEERKADAKVTQLGNEKILTIENIQDPQVQGYRIYYDPQTFVIRKMLIGMLRLTPLEEVNEDSIEEIPDGKTEEPVTDDRDVVTETEIDTYTYYMEVVYKEIKVLAINEEAFSPENKFVRINGKNVELASPFKNYQLIINSKESEKEMQKNSEEE